MICLRLILDDYMMSEWSEWLWSMQKVTTNCMFIHCKQLCTFFMSDWEIQHIAYIIWKQNKKKQLMWSEWKNIKLRTIEQNTNLSVTNAKMKQSFSDYLSGRTEERFVFGNSVCSILWLTLNVLTEETVYEACQSRCLLPSWFCVYQDN
jgi:hypothetical protein